ncbi:MAG: glutaminyl-peptide cyclotransferase [Limisphaerales bacterium]|jgi:glutaminyl-peptide cyclotransferase
MKYLCSPCVPIWAILFFSAFFIGCGGNQDAVKPDVIVEESKSEEVMPEQVKFNADNAYNFIDEQVAFGPRVPGTKGHANCGKWLVEYMTQHADKVFEQNVSLMAWDKRELPCKNIIAAFNPEAKKRIMLSAHWDTRPVADEDTERKDEPIDGANDGGSGVGVLMEMARLLGEHNLNYGIDIVLFDVEDYGNAAFQDSYCLGSQYWSKNPHIEDYDADYGILLDMVGAEGAYFYKEGISMYYAPDIVAKVWDAAAKAGARSWFMYNEPPYPQITDDHLYVNRIAGIRTIDIIQYDKNNTEKGFGDFWHTHKDNMDIIDRKTLDAVGRTLVELLWSEQN